MDTSDIKTDTGETQNSLYIAELSRNKPKISITTLIHQKSDDSMLINALYFIYYRLITNYIF